MSEPRLRIEPEKLPVANDYRIRDGQIEVRLIDQETHRAGRWRKLDRNQIELHRALQTLVANWMDTRLESKPS